MPLEIHPIYDMVAMVLWSLLRYMAYRSRYLLRYLLPEDVLLVLVYGILFLAVSLVHRDIGPYVLRDIEYIYSLPSSSTVGYIGCRLSRYTLDVLDAM